MLREMYVCKLPIASLYSILHPCENGQFIPILMYPQTPTHAHTDTLALWL